MNRREVLSYLGALAAGACLGQAQAQAASGVRRFRLGSLEMAVLQDGSSRLSSAHPMFGGLNATAAEVSGLLRQHGSPNGLEISRNILLVREGSENILLDTGLGQDLIPNLRRAGLEPQDITGVVISHVHYGHHNGLLRGSQAAFPNAQVFVPKAELEASGGAEFAAYGKRVQALERGGRISPSLRYVDTSGHTVAHQALEIVSNNQRLLCVVDAAYNQIISFRRPDWSFQFDNDSAAAAKSRRRLLEMASERGTQVHGYHFPFPGLGVTQADGTGFAFQANP
jgi:glyoxylase-like metal-dependent hydrolase (beta-lactamase superfamily II)